MGDDRKWNGNRMAGWLPFGSGGNGWAAGWSLKPRFTGPG